MLIYDQAIEKMSHNVIKYHRRVENISILDSVNRVISKPIYAKMDLPSFDNSALDGFAFRFQDCGATRNRYLTVLAGDIPYSDNLQYSDAVQIMTGAPIPRGADTVVAVENTNLIENTVHFLKDYKKGQAIRKKGSDIKCGELCIEIGSRITPKHILALAALGIDEVEVYEKIKINLISTGDEVTTNSEQLQPGKIYNSTMPLLKLLAETEAVDFKYFGHIGDEPNLFKNFVENIISNGTDLLITTGAVSMGTKDYVPEIFRKLNIKKIFHRVAIKPGKPIWCGNNKSTFIFGLPGNPISTYIGWSFFVKPYIEMVYGIKKNTSHKFILTNSVNKPKNLRCFYKAKYSGTRVTVLDGQESYKISSLLESNCFAILPEGKDMFYEGENLEVFPL